MMEGFRKLIAWQEAKLLTLKIYKSTSAFPQHELFSLTNQLRRASSSAMANIAEGSAMATSAHRKAYYQRAKGSVIEVDNFIELGFELGYVSGQDFDDLSDHCARLTHLLKRLVQTT